MRIQGIIDRYRSHLPVTDDAKIVSLGEGNTPLVLAPRLAEAIHPRIELHPQTEISALHGNDPEDVEELRLLGCTTTRAGETGDLGLTENRFPLLRES